MHAAASDRVDSSLGCKHAGLPEAQTSVTVCGTEDYLLSISAFWRNG